MKPLDGSQVKVQEAIFNMDVEEFVFKWKLENIVSPTGRVLKESLDSPVFFGGTKCQYSWKLKWSKHSHMDRYYVGLYSIENVKWDVPSEDIEVAASVTLKDSDIRTSYGIYPPKFLRTEARSKKVRLWEGSAQIDLDDLLSPEKGYLSDNNAITATCRIWQKYSESTSLALVKPELANQDSIGVEELCGDMTNLLTSPNFSDFTLRTPTKSFPVHKAILAARSPVFAAMLGSDMLEGRQNIVEITDADSDAVAGMLEYIYTGKTSKLNPGNSDESHSSELLRLADKYQLDGLKGQSEFKLSSVLTVTNAAEILILADRHNSVHLKAAVVQFITTNKESVLAVPSFKLAMKAHPDLLLELFQSV